MATRAVVGALLGKHTVRELAAAVERGPEVRAHRRDAIAEFPLPAEPWEQTMVGLDGREQLRYVKVTCSQVSSYSDLLANGGVA